MAHSRSSTPSASTAGRHDGVRTYIAYTLIGLSNVLLPTMIFSCSYLIVPYPRPAVILIESLPALAAKFVLPQIIHHVAYWVRPLLIASSWAFCGVITWSSPPSHDPKARILMVMLAAATSAATDIWMLGMLRYYGRQGVAGWGFGTGLGYVTAALYPWFVTVFMRAFLRSSLAFLPYMVLAATAAYYIVLPGSLSMKLPGHGTDKQHVPGNDNEQGLSLLAQQSSAPAQSVLGRLFESYETMSNLFKPFMLPIYASLAIQTIVFPTFARAQAVAPWFDSFLGYATAYGFAFQFGNLLGRSSILVKRVNRISRLRIWLLFALIAVFWNTAMLLTSALVVVFGITTIIGIMCGALYINTIDAALDTSLNDTPAHAEYILGLISAFDAAGILIGGLVGSVVQKMYCDLEGGDRWCHHPN